MAEPATLLLEGGFVLALDAQGTAGELAIAVGGRRIAGVGPAEDLRRRFPAAERVDCAGRVVLPGLVNAHLHPELQILKGAVEQLDLHSWEGAQHFDAALRWLGSQDGRDAQRAAIRASLADAALGGTTCVACYGVSTHADVTSARELRALGLRGMVTVRDVAFPQLPPGAPPHMYRLHAEEALTEAELTAASAAHGRGERIVMHAAETRTRVELARARFGASTIRLLDRYGLLSPRVLLSHAVHVDDDEISLIAERGAVVISSPVAESKLADGIAPVHEYLQRGVEVALGTDAAVCNNSTDMFLEMRQLGLTQKLRYGAGALSAEQILRSATRAGAVALGAPGRYGSIEPGRSADLALVDLRNPRLLPLVHRQGYSNVAANLVYAATAQDVTDVMVAGRWIVRERRLLTADPMEVWSALEKAAHTLFDHVL